MTGIYKFVWMYNIKQSSLLSLAPTSYWLLSWRWCLGLRRRKTIVSFDARGSSLTVIHHVFCFFLRLSGRGVQMWEVGFWLHWQLWGTRSLSEQEMTWPSLWEANPAWHQPPPLGTSQVTLSTHKGQTSDSSPAGRRKNKNMLCSFPSDRKLKENVILLWCREKSQA